MRSHYGMRLLRVVAFFVPIVAAAGITFSAHARPLVLEEVAKLTLPDSSYSCCGRVAISENIIIVTASRAGRPPNTPDTIEQAAFAFERNAAGEWQYITRLVEQTKG